MSPLMTSIAHGTAQIMEAPILFGAAVVAFGARMLCRSETKLPRRTARLDGRTMSDIGIERGSITWLG